MSSANEAEAAAMPQNALIGLLFGYRSTALLFVAAKLRLADHLKDGPKSGEELARLAGAHPDTVRRFTRGLVNLGVFDETAEGYFALNAVGELLRSDGPGSLWSMALYFGELSYRAYEGLLHAARTGEIAFNHVFGVGFYDHLATHPEIQEAYHQTLTVGGVAPLMALAFDYSQVRRLVDVGGSDGAAMCAILGSYAQLTGVVFDEPAAAEPANAKIQEAGLASRCEFVGGDFFVSVPSGGDLYLLARVLANWGDEQARTILANIHAAMLEGGTLIVIEQVMPTRVERGDLAVDGDINVLAHLGGRIRTQAEFVQLLRAGGFELARSTPIAPWLRRGFYLLEAKRTS
jgi:hypothetical protein